MHANDVSMSEISHDVDLSTDLGREILGTYLTLVHDFYGDANV